MKGKQPLVILETERAERALDAFTLSTPFGTITITDGGRHLDYDLYPDIRQSRHNVALFAYIQKLRKEGVTKFNTDHLAISGRDKRLSLVRGNARLDLVYEKRGKLYECELKTNREIGLDVTARQLNELCRHVEKLTLLVPRGALSEAEHIIGLINLGHQIVLEPYDGWGEDED
jgi:hypothetical protein